MAENKSKLLPIGLYEQLITEELETALLGVDDSATVLRSRLRSADAPDRLALHLSGLLEVAVASVDEEQRSERGLQLARELAAHIADFVQRDELAAEAPVLDEAVLDAILGCNPDGSIKTIKSPLIPLLDTTLLTNAHGEPRIGHQLVAEIESAASVDLIMAFIRRSGIRPFVKEFRRHCGAGRKLRILTTTYTNSTEQAALQELIDVGADVRVSYDTSGTRLHAKAWLFHRPGGMSTAYIGSSNLTHQAQRTGLEWNVRVSGRRNSSVVEKMSAVFDSYWEGGDFRPFDAEEFASSTDRQTSMASTILAPIEIRLYPFQERLLEQIAVSRQRDRHANLLVAATGTGKTVMAAVDYARLARKLDRARLLFVAHSKEILEQSLVTFRHAVRDGEFGELWVGGETPRHWEYVFASIQSLNANGLKHLDPEHFDLVIVDEFHHGAAKSYEKFLEFIKPKEMLGLTATPERADGLDILKWFGGRIAAELRLWDAIDQGRLVPFDYYGIHDNSDLTGVAWRRGKGYDTDQLTNVYTADDAWAKLVLAQLEKRVNDLATVKALGFCVSIAHAQFMAKVFCSYGIAAKAIWGSTPAGERKAALNELRRGDINIIFSVDLFNEGVDLPTVETLLLLRPTESPVLFLQQLGRGLRKAEGKISCTVLDFIGQHRREFRLHPKLQAFFGGSRLNIKRQVEGGFPFLPSGCHMDLEPKARDIVLQSIRNAVPSQWGAKVAELKSLASEGESSLSGFLEHSGLEVDDVYRGGHSWSELREAAGLRIHQSGPSEELLRKACGRTVHVNDFSRLSAYREFLNLEMAPTYSDLEARDARFARMLVAQVCAQALKNDSSLQDGIDLLWQHRQVRSELVELFDLLESRVDHLNVPLSTHPKVPLQIHGRYTRIEILAASDPRNRGKTQAWREGIYWLKDIQTDVLVFTLDKTSGQFSPTTRYRDYAISRNLIHWESQSTVRAESPTGLRYRNQIAAGTHVLLFARESSDDRAFWFLGGADFVKHEGEKPMAITWRLHHSLPGDLYASFAAAVA